MKKLMLAVAAVAAVMGAQAADVVKDGKPVAAVRMGERPNAQVKLAVQELTNWVAKITGAVLPVDAAGAAKTEIFVGSPETSQAIADFAGRNADDFAKFSDNDGFIIAEEGGFLGFGGKRIYIAGAETKGALNGVYRFLTANSDLIFARPLESENGFGTIYGETREFRNTLTHRVEVPSLRSTRFWRGTDSWLRRLMCNVQWQGNIRYKVNQKEIDRWCTQWNLAEAEIFIGTLDHCKESDPDVFPLLKNGKRDFGHDHQLCFMNPKTAELSAKDAVEKLRGQDKRFAKLSVPLGDNWSLCTCKEWCSKPIDCGGGVIVRPEDKNFRSTQYAIYVNRVSDLIRKELPHIKPIETGMYLFLTEPPGVPVAGSSCYCPYVKNHKRPVFDDAVNQLWHEKAERFYAKGIHFGKLYEYYLCCTTPRFYHAVDEVAQQDYQYYIKHGLRGCYLDTGAYDEWRFLNSDVWVMDVSAIEFWTMAQIFWNVDVDVKACRREYCRRAYREAGEIMGDFYERMAANYNGDPAGCFWNDDPVSAAQHYITEKNLQGWVRETLAKAEDAAKHPGSKELVRRLRERMEMMISEAEKKPKKIQLAVGKDWTPVAPLTAICNAAKPPRKGVKMWVKNDNENLYLKVQAEAKRYRAIYDKAKAENRLYKEKEVFDWCNCAELYVDGGLGAKGGFYQCAVNFDGMRWSNVKLDWDAKVSAFGENGVTVEVTWPLASIGVDISKGNKVGAMFIIDESSWNGGQWNSPTGFQTLQLNMD